MGARTETEWDDTERGWMTALAELDADTCPGCGGWLSETTDPAAEYAYETDAIRCHRCTALAIDSTRFHDVNHPHALLHTATRKR